MKIYCQIKIQGLSRYRLQILFETRIDNVNKLYTNKKKTHNQKQNILRCSNCSMEYKNYKNMDDIIPPPNGKCVENQLFSVKNNSSKFLYTTLQLNKVTCYVYNYLKYAQNNNTNISVNTTKRHQVFYERLNHPYFFVRLRFFQYSMQTGGQ